MRVKGLVHIYCGDGKGKTTAAIGLAVRMAGTGRRVLFTRFLKTEHSGELKILDEIDNIDVIHMERSFGFYRTLNEEQKEELKKTYRSLWDEIKNRAATGEYDLLVMDEVLHALNYEILSEKEMIDFLKSRPEELEVVLTGRKPSDHLSAFADYLSEIRKLKHPFDSGIRAREGIEY